MIDPRLLVASILFRVAPVALILGSVLAAPASAQSVASATIVGTVVDAASGLPLADADVRIVGAQGIATRTDANGTFSSPLLVPGTYHIEVHRVGYATTLSDEVAVEARGTAHVSLSLRIADTTGGLQSIGHVSTRPSSSLTTTSIIEKNVSPADIQRLGYFRAADLLRTLPQVNRGADAESSAPGDDYPLSIRGIGAMETTVLLDGHPIGNGVSPGFNFQVSPTFGLRNISVAYGSGGSDLSGVDAIGGVINMQTIDPTQHAQAEFTQGLGSYGKAATIAVATGSLGNAGRVGYALAFGSQGTDGVYKNRRTYAPGAAFDQSAPVGSPVYNLGVFPIDTTVTNKALMAKVRLKVGSDASPSIFQMAVYDTHYYFNKTGNGDLDYQPYDAALAQGNNLLANYAPPTGSGITPMTPACPAGTFQAFSTNGAPNGFGPDGNPDGGLACQTPQQYAKFNTGLQGPGTAWEDFRVSDYHPSFATQVGAGHVAVDGFTNLYAVTRDRRNALPFNSVPGDNGSYNNTSVNTAGGSIIDDFAGSLHDVGVGVLYFNSAYFFKNNGKQQPSPITNNESIFFRDIYRPNTKITAFFDGNYKYASITKSYYFDPRVAVNFASTRNDTIRLAFGLATTQPWATATFLPLSTSLFNSNVICGRLNPVGTGINPTAHPERATDQELEVIHRFGGDSQVQVALYNENVFNKLQLALLPLSAGGAGNINPGTLATFEKIYTANCGAGNPLDSLALTTTVNLGHVLARGFDISGRQRLQPTLFADYDYSESTVEAIGGKQFNITPGQLQNVPLHKASLAFDKRFGALDARLTGYFVSVNNPKNLTGYAYADFELGYVLPSGLFNIAVTNAFNSHASPYGYQFHGIPYPDGTPNELFLLPYRQVYASYTVRVGSSR